MEEKKTASVKMEYDVNNKMTVGAVLSGDPSVLSPDITSNISKAIAESFNKLSGWTKEFVQLIKSGKHLEAYGVFNLNKDSLRFNNTLSLEEMLTLDRSVLNPDQRKEFVLYIILVAEDNQTYGPIEKILDDLLTEFGDDFKPGLKQLVQLAKGNAASQNEMFNVANSTYRQVINDPGSSSSSIAFAYRGLSMNASSENDFELYKQKAIDKFLEAGDRKRAIQDIVALSDKYQKKNPPEALKLIDKALSLFNLNTSLDKEYAASLYHRKAVYLHFIGREEEALKEIETACSLREDLFGNEHPKHSSYSLANQISENLHLKDKAEHYKAKAQQLIPLINTEEYQLQTELMDTLNGGKIVEGDLLQRIENSDNEQFKFSTYLLNGSSKTIPSTARLAWLDKGKKLLATHHFTNQHHTLIYHQIAEEYRESNAIKDALTNYEKALEYNPLHFISVQNCGAMLWDSKNWEDSVIFFKKRIDLSGEYPSLCYAYGRSLFETAHYQEAFDYFKKCEGKVQGADITQYITQCVQKATNLQLNSPRKETPLPDISLDEFKQVIDEFSRNVSADSRMHFWQYDKEAGHKWAPSPEEIGKQLLITTLNAKFGRDGIDLSQEQKSGAGIIDLFVVLRGGLKITIELKMCGGGYASTYAISGEDQLVHYISNKQTKIGFLIVFDGRLKDFGVGLKPLQSINDITIYTTAVDLSPKVLKNTIK